MYIVVSFQTMAQNILEALHYSLFEAAGLDSIVFLFNFYFYFTILCKGIKMHKSSVIQ